MQAPQSSFAARLSEALNGLAPATFAKSIGVAKQSVEANLAGSMPQADRALLFADALGVSYRWLVSGEGPRQKSSVTLDQSRWVLMPFYDLAQFQRRSIDGRIELPPVIEMVPVRRVDLARLHATRSEVWLIEMPTGVLPSVARQGELVVCQDSGIGFRDRRVVIIAIGDDPTIIRRVVRDADGAIRLEADDPAVPAIQAEQLAEGYTNLGEIIGAIRINPAS